jgi:hypothetical protein
VFKYSSRFWLYAPISVFLLLAIAAMVHWWILDSAFEKKLAALKGHEAVPGITLDWDRVEVGGFPFRIDANFSNFRVQGAGAHGPFSWKTDKFAAHALTYGRRQVIYEAAGQQDLRLTLVPGQKPAALSFQVGSLRASSINNSSGLARFDLDMAQAGQSHWTINRFQFHMRRDPDGKNLDLVFQLEGLALRIQPIPGIALAVKPGDLSFYATLNHLDAFKDFLDGKTSWPDAAEKWRAEGGSATLSQVKSGGATVLAPQVLTAPLY